MNGLRKSYHETEIQDGIIDSNQLHHERCDNGGEAKLMKKGKKRSSQCKVDTRPNIKIKVASHLAFPANDPRLHHRHLSDQNACTH